MWWDKNGSCFFTISQGICTDCGKIPALPEADKSKVQSEVQVFPTQYRVSVSLHCCERYSGKGITMLVKKPAATICKYLHKARIQLSQQLGGAYDAA